ncbi:hypothetical protein JOB18_023824 [Solea senegalensis]|uniref:Uncharacterized protein n=1 Tax=Solea senegalensis TaxID=28829 RepID=A0AAV6PQS9_SOLSE|nr:hypothetical protein JOB18_023824 [Solea senegalensis]
MMGIKARPPRGRCEACRVPARGRLTGGGRPQCSLQRRLLLHRRGAATFVKVGFPNPSRITPDSDSLWGSVCW